MTRVVPIVCLLALITGSPLLAQQPALRNTLMGHARAVCGVAFSPDGRLLASASQDKTVKLWEVGTGKNDATLQHSDPVESITFSPDGQTLASGGLSNAILLWNVKARKVTSTFQTAHWVKSLAFSPDGAILASGHCFNEVYLWEVATGRAKAILQRDELAIIQSIAFSPDGTLLAAATGNDASRAWASSAGIGLWTVATGCQRAFLKGHTGPVNSVAFSPDGRTLASGSFDNTIRLWDVASANNTATLKAIPKLSVTVNGSATVGVAVSANSIAFSPDGRTLAVGNGDSTVGLWDVTTRKRITDLPDHIGLTTVAFSPDGTVLAVGGLDGTIKLWDVATLVRRE